MGYCGSGRDRYSKQQSGEEQSGLQRPSSVRLDHATKKVWSKGAEEWNYSTQPLAFGFMPYRDLDVLGGANGGDYIAISLGYRLSGLFGFLSFLR